MYFIEFLRMFRPEIVKDIDPGFLQFMDKELNALTHKRKRVLDLVVKVRYKNSFVFFIILIEMQASSKPGFPRRMFLYYSRLLEKYGLPIYPIVLCTFDNPKRPEPNHFRIDFPGLNVLRFEYHVIQLNRLDWHDFLKRPNPVAGALMAKMKVAPKDRPKLKLACLRTLGKLKLKDGEAKFLSGFVDTYLPLSWREQRQYDAVLNQVEPIEKERVMEMTTSWKKEGIKQGRKQGLKLGMKKGIEKGREEGIEEGQRAGEVKIVLRLLRARLGSLDVATTDQIHALPLARVEDLSEALLCFTKTEELNAWLKMKAKG